MPSSQVRDIARPRLAQLAATATRAAFAAFSTLIVLLAAPHAARADGLEGRWKQGPLREEYTVQQWLPGCGAPPVTSASGGGEIVTVKEDGDELTFLGGGRTFHTNQCYDELPTLVRDAHSRDASGRQWRTRCSTPPSDPRHAVMNTLVAATNDSHIDVTETGRYEITLKEGRCIADVKRTRAFDLVPTTAPAPTPAVSAAPAPKPTATAAEPVTPACKTPGDPARLEVRPSRKLLRTGETFAFHAVVRDAKGCATSTATEWSIANGDASHVTVDANGNVAVAGDAPEGAVDLVVTAAGKSAHVTVDVSSPAHYDGLLAQEGLNAAGENEEAAVAVIAGGSLGGKDAAAQGNAGRRRAIFLGVVGGIAGLLALVAFIGWRRARRAAALERDAEARHEQKLREIEERRREKAARHAAQLRAHEDSVKRAADAAAAAEKEEEAARATASSASSASAAAARVACPACHREYPAGSTYCPNDGSKLVPVAGHEAMLAGPAGMICPTCKRGFDPGTKTCPDDGDELVPYALRGTLSAAAAGPAKGKICPTCGGRFDGSASFCGKDGTALVLLN